MYDVVIEINRQRFIGETCSRLRDAKKRYEWECGLPGNPRIVEIVKTDNRGNSKVILSNRKGG